MRRFWFSGWYEISQGEKKFHFHREKKFETGSSARAHMMEVCLVVSLFYYDLITLSKLKLVLESGWRACLYCGDNRSFELTL